MPVAVLLHTPPIGAVHTWGNTCGVPVASALGFSSFMALWYDVHCVALPALLRFFSGVRNCVSTLGVCDVVHLCTTRSGLAYCTCVVNIQTGSSLTQYICHCVSPCDTYAMHVYSMYTVFRWFLVSHLRWLTTTRWKRSSKSRAYRLWISSQQTMVIRHTVGRTNKCTICGTPVV